MTKSPAIYCDYCTARIFKPNNYINRAKREGKNLYCDKKCAGLGRRDKRTDAEKKKDKREYDLIYRKENLERITQEKREYFKRTYDPEKAKKERKKNMARHIEYCRQPWYREWKRNYDRKYNAKQSYGEFHEAALVLRDIEQEVDKRMDWDTRAAMKGTLNKKLQRRREYDRLNRF